MTIYPASKKPLEAGGHEQIMSIYHQAVNSSGSKRAIDSMPLAKD